MTLARALLAIADAGGSVTWSRFVNPRLERGGAEWALRAVVTSHDETLCRVITFLPEFVTDAGPGVVDRMMARQLLEAASELFGVDLG